MQNHFLLGISVGEAFAEFCLLQDSKVIATKRAYLTRENLKNSLQQFVAGHTDKKITKAAVTVKVPERLMDFNLNGAVAHVTTEGFENWLNLHQSAYSSFTKKDMQFSLRERIHADGTVAISLDVPELESLLVKLQQTETKKVCIHLLHSAKNPAHENMASQFLIEKGFEVFVPEKTDNADEVSRWKRNALNATLASLFADIKKEIEEALKECLAVENIHYLNSAGEFSYNIEKDSIGSLNASYSALALASENQNCDLLYLGLESFCLISPNKWESHWTSPWGEIENRQVVFRPLEIQPTMGIELNKLERFDFSNQMEGWEPGPMFLGRGQKATLLDLWSESSKLAKLDGLQDRVMGPGIQRFKNVLFALSKISHGQSTEVPAISKELLSLAVQKLAMETSLFKQNEEITIIGPLADLFGNAFKKDKQATIKTDEFALAHSVAILGQKLLVGTQAKG